MVSAEARGDEALDWSCECGVVWIEVLVEKVPSF